jgi:thioredoxin reductase (NADPH)
VTENQNVAVDLLIIGAGPTGLYSAYYAGFRGMTVAVIESLPELGGQITAMYPEKMIFDVAGFPTIKGQHLVDGLVAQAAAAKPRYLLQERAEELHADDEQVTVTTHTGRTVTARAVIIAGGIGTFSPRPLPGAEPYEGRGLRYFVPRLDELRDHDVLIVGGGDSAVDWALALEGIAKSLTLIHRRTAFRAHEGSVERLMSSSVRVLTPYRPGEIHGDPQTGRISAVTVSHADSGEAETLEVTSVVAALGFLADLGPITRWGLELDKRHIVVDSAMRTSVPRVFAAGDINSYPGKVRLISVALGEAATAVNNAAVVVNPDAKVFPGHSSAG